MRAHLFHHTVIPLAGCPVTEAYCFGDTYPCNAIQLTADICCFLQYMINMMWTVCRRHNLCILNPYALSTRTRRQCITLLFGFSFRHHPVGYSAMVIIWFWILFYEIRYVRHIMGTDVMNVSVEPLISIETCQPDMRYVHIYVCKTWSVCGFLVRISVWFDIPSNIWYKTHFCRQNTC